MFNKIVKLTTNILNIFRVDEANHFDWNRLTSININIEKVLDDLGIYAAAKDNGSHEIPNELDKQLDGPQSTIVHYIEGLITKVEQEALVSLAEFNKRINSIDLDWHIQKINNIKDSYRQLLFALVEEQKNKLEKCKKRYDVLKLEYDNFKNNKFIEREPDYPESKSWHWVLLAGILVFETLINSYFFALGNDFGWLGGAWQAFIVAFVNISISFRVGRGITYINATTLVQKSIGYMCILLFLFWASIYNLVIAHYRDSLNLGVDNAYVDALSNFQSHMFGLMDLNSWLLFIVGISISATVAFDAFNWDDKFPGYGKIHRKLKEAEEDYIYEKELLFEKGAHLRNEGREQLDTLTDEALKRIKLLEHDVDTKVAMMRNVKTYISYCQQCCNTLIRKYRDENIKYRKTPPPNYFQETWNYPIPKDFQDDMSMDREKLTGQKKKVESVIYVSKQMQNDITDTYNSFLNKAEKY